MRTRHNTLSIWKKYNYLKKVIKSCTTYYQVLAISDWVLTISRTFSKELHSEILNQLMLKKHALREKLR